MPRYAGTFLPIERPGATTPPLEGPGHLKVGESIVLEGGRERPWISRGVGCLFALGALVVGLAAAVLIAEFAWDFTRVRRGTSLIAMVCLFLMMTGWGAGTKLVKLVLGRRSLRTVIPRAALRGVEQQGQQLVVAWDVGDAPHLAFFVPQGASFDEVVASIRG
jgi:hypothetical protein